MSTLIYNLIRRLNIFYKLEQQKCMEEAYDVLISSENLKKYQQNCPLECNATEYDTTLSSVELIGDLYAEYIGQTKGLKNDFVTKEVNSETAKQAFSSFQLFYNTNSYTLLKETPTIDIATLLANIGKENV